MKKRKVKKKNCVVWANLKQTSTNIFMFGVNAVWPYVVCRAMLGKYIYKKGIMDEFISFSYFYQ